MRYFALFSRVFEIHFYLLDPYHVSEDLVLVHEGFYEQRHFYPRTMNGKIGTKQSRKKQVSDKEKKKNGRL